jgi:4-hydroxybenzoate polyprenyltransferase
VYPPRVLGESDRPKWFKSSLVSIYLLELVGACGITALGGVACAILSIDWSRSAPLWFAGYLLVYNADRLYLDPADRLNTPLRTRWAARLRGWRIVLVSLSAGIVIIWPVLTQRFWLLFPLAAVFGILCFYSRPIPSAGFRLKDLPFLKSLLAPIVIATVLVLWPVWESGSNLREKVWLVFFWILLILTINALVCDYRDIEGDKLAGTLTIPVLLGQRRTRRLLMALAASLVLLSIALCRIGLACPLMPVFLAIGTLILLYALRCRPHPLLISLIADVLLFLPALAELFR